MIITRTPLRLCLGGGGTDVKDYYSEHGGFVVSAALNQYIYVVIHNSFDKSIRICYSKREIVQSADEVHHPVVRAAMKLFGITDKGIEIISFADVPSDTGLGSSSSFTVGLIAALAAYKRIRMTQYEIAEMACHIERDILKEAGGKQDQYIAAFGGVQTLEFHKDGSVDVSPIQVSHESIERLENNIMLFFTGIKRNSFQVQKELVRGVKKQTRALDSLHVIKDLGFRTEALLKSGDIDTYSDLLKEHWEAKQKLSDKISNAVIDKYYERGIEAGAESGKIIGAGGGGYLLFYCSDPVKRENVREAMSEEKLLELNYSYDFTGVTILVDDGVRNRQAKPVLI